MQLAPVVDALHRFDYRAEACLIIKCARYNKISAQGLELRGSCRGRTERHEPRSLLAAASRHEDDDWVCRLLGHNGQRRWKLFFYLFDLVNLRLSIFFQSCARQRRRVVAKICICFMNSTLTPSPGTDKA